MSVEKYRRANETDKVWQLRRLFIETFKERFDEDRLLCLAQCYANVETMGCRYSNEIMNQIRELTADFKPLIEERTSQKRQQPPNSCALPKKPPSTKFTQGANLHLNTTEIGLNNKPQKQPQIQILTKNKTVVNNELKVSMSTSPTSKTKPSFRPMSAKINVPTPSIPSSTTEQSPAPSLVPIPFGLANNNNNNNECKLDDQRTPIINSRNALLNSLLSPAANKQQPISETKSNPLSILLGLNLEKNPDSQFIKLNRITKLREVIKSDAFIQSFVKNDFSNKDVDIVEYFKKLCDRNEVELRYAQYAMKNNEGYQGEIYLEGFRLAKDWDKKRKRCCFFAHRKAVSLLCGESEMAVRSAHANKRDSGLRLDVDGEEANQEVAFEYELHLVDLDHENLSSCSAPNPQTLPLKTHCAIFDSSDLANVSPPLLDGNFYNDSNNNQDSISSLNSMLKSLILPNSCNVVDLENAVGSEVWPAEEEMQDDEENERCESADKKTRRIREALGEFCLFVPESSEGYDANEPSSLIDKQNAISVLYHICAKNNSKLEFVDDENENETQKRKNKCKLLINGAKIASTHYKNKRDAKRQLCMKAFNVLSKIYPIIMEKNYANEVNQTTFPTLPTLPTTNNQPTQQRYFKITKDDLFKGLVPPTLFETASAASNLAGCQQPLIANTSLGVKLLVKMGWKGEGYGLGRCGQGITKPIEFDMNKCRLGLGCRIDDGYEEERNELNDKPKKEDFIDPNDTISRPQSKTELMMSKFHANRRNNQTTTTGNNYLIRKNFVNNIVNLLENFTSSETSEDLVVKNVSSEERKLIHREGHRLGLKTQSHGSGDNRFLVVQKKKTSKEIFDSLLKNGGQASNYTLLSGGKK